ncbi:MAG: hypothetical protein ACHWZW_08405 [Spirulina sp.]
MPQAMQGMVIGLLISLLVGIIIGFYLRQRQVNALTATLKTGQEREQALQQEHEHRLRTATAQLQQDYEAQLAEKIERYQHQYEAQRQQLEAEYEARQNLMPGGSGLADADAQDPNASPSDEWNNAPVSEYEAHLRRQYEARLKEAAYKIQQAYEQHLRETLAAEREAQQQAYDQRLVEAIARYQDEADARLAEALKDQDAVAQTVSGENSLASSGLDDAEAEVQERLATLEAELRRDYDRRLAERIEQYQDDMSQRIAQLEEEFAARLQMAQAAQPVDEPPQFPELPTNAELEARLKTEYDQRLAEAVARHQDELLERTQALEQDYEARLQMALGGGEGAAEGEERLHQTLEAELRAEYDLKLAETLGQFQAELNQRAQDFESGLIATIDPFTDPAIAAEPLEEDDVMVDPFPDVDAFQSVMAAAEEDSPVLNNQDAPPLDLGAMDDGDAGLAAEVEALVQANYYQDAGEGLDNVEALGAEQGLENLDLDPFPDLDSENATLDVNDGGEASNPSEMETAFNLDDLDLSALSDDALADLSDEDLFDLETLARRAGVDLGELNNLLNQVDAPTPSEAENADPENEDWGSLS